MLTGAIFAMSRETQSIHSWSDYDNEYHYHISMSNLVTY